MKIFHLVTNLGYGGLERRMEILSKYPSINNELYFCALGQGGTTHERLVARGSNVNILNTDFRIFNKNTLILLLKYIKKINPDIIHTHGCEANFYGILAGRILGIKIIIAEEIGIPKLTNKSKLVFKLIYKLCNSVIAMSPIVLDYLKKEKIVHHRKLDLVYNPVILSKSRKSPLTQLDQSVKFLYIGRLELIKNPFNLLKAFHMLIADGTQAFLTFIGAGSQFNILEEYINKHNINKQINLNGYASDPLALALQHDVIVQPSHTEGFSLALVEGMSCGLPALATKVGSATSLIVNGSNGWLLESSSTDDIYNGLKLACTNKKLLYSMGQKAADLVSFQNNPEIYAEKLDNYYASIINK